MINFVHGSIFNAPKKSSLAQCISGDTKFGMFRGISVDFLRHFPELQILRGKSMSYDKLGTAVPVKVEERFIYNLVTKPLHYMKPTKACVYSALHSMRAHAIENSVLNLAIPLLGSGCDKLDFCSDVFPMLEDVFEGTGISIEIFYLKLTPALLRLKGLIRLVISCFFLLHFLKQNTLL